MSETKILKINNPLYVANLVPMIQDFLDKTDLPNMNIHSMVAFFQRTVQIGGELVELWAAFDGEEPVGFANWCVRDLPLIGSVHLNFVYCKANRKDFLRQLVTEFKNFGIKHHSPWYMYDVANNPKLINHFNSIAEEFGYDPIKQPYTPFIVRKKVG
jgi:hypothetical protein